MKIRKTLFLKLICPVALAILITFWSEAYSQSDQSGNPVKLQYNYPMNQPVKYISTAKVIQTMDFGGQTMEVNIKTAFGCTVKANGNQGSNMKLEITVDTLGQSTESPMGSSGGAVADVTGKAFNIVVAPEGKSVDVSEAQKFTYTIEGSGETDLSQAVSDFFPVLPANSVKPGDTWNFTDSVTSKSTAMSMKMMVNSVNKLEGYETAEGMECAKISAVISGTRQMTVVNQGMDIFIKGPFSGTAEILFAVKEGYFIRQTVTTKMTGNMEITSPEAMSFPVVMDMTTVSEVKK
jgi:hypothetical protein